MFHCYIIENTDKKMYIGSTGDLQARIMKHNANEGVKRWTKGKGPWKMIYSEEYETRSDAMTREKYLKSLKAGQKIKKLLDIGL